MSLDGDLAGLKIGERASLNMISAKNLRWYSHETSYGSTPCNERSSKNVSVSKAMSIIATNYDKVLEQQAAFISLHQSSPVLILAGGRIHIF